MSEVVLGDILKKISVLRPNADREESAMPRDTKSGLMVAKRQAQDEIDNLRRSYQNTLLSKMDVFYVEDTANSKQIQALQDVTTKMSNVLFVEASGFYAPLAANLVSIVGREKQYLPTHCAALSGMALMRGRETGFFNMTHLDFKAGEVVNDYASALKLVRNSIREANGDEPNVTFTVTQLLEQAEAVGFSGDRLTVVLYGVPNPEVWAFRKRFPNSSVLDISSLKKINTENLSLALGLTKAAVKEEK